jgi:hypothetical protein
MYNDPQDHYTTAIGVCQVLTRQFKPLKKQQSRDHGVAEPLAFRERQTLAQPQLQHGKFLECAGVFFGNAGLLKFVY